MRYKILLTAGAERDLADIHNYLLEHESSERANHVMVGLRDKLATLAEPNRGNIPKELSLLGVTEFRELHYQPYRVIYIVEGQNVSIVCIADGRRNMQSFLYRRLVR